MSKPWIGAARRISADAFDEAAHQHNLDPAVVRAVWDVESSGKPFRADGSVERRYEPHHMPGSGITNWRDSLKISTDRREEMFAEAYQRDPDAAMRASSWGGPQIMGFNAEAAGFDSVGTMVRAMAADEAHHLAAFMTLVEAWGLITVLRAHDWQRFAARYNGSGQAAAYAAKIETAYRRHSGRASPVVLRLGRAGNVAAVKKLQAALGIKEDGVFGQETDKAVRAFQQARGLEVDGIVGNETWAQLTAWRAASAPVQDTQQDRIGRISAISGAVTAVTGAIAAIGDVLPDSAMTILVAGATAAGVMTVAAFLWMRLRREGSPS